MKFVSYSKLGVYFFNTDMYFTRADSPQLVESKRVFFRLIRLEKIFALANAAHPHFANLS